MPFPTALQGDGGLFLLQTVPLAQLLGPEVADTGRFCTVAQPSREGTTFSSWGLNLRPTAPRAGSPPPQVCEEGAGSSLKKAPQLEIRSLSVSVQGLYPVQIWSYNSLASLSLPLVSLQKAVPPLHAHAAFFLNLPHFTVTHLSFLQLSHFLPSRCSLFSSQALVFKVFWLLHLFV